MSDTLDTEAPITHKTDSWTPRAPVEDQPTMAMPWTYEQTDPALMLFTAAVRRFNLRFPMGSRVLELGCAESDWLERMHRMDHSLTLVGVDARRQERASDGIQIIEGSAMDCDLFENESFDWIVMLGALEHFGLGFYGDRVLPGGDTITMHNVSAWLKPGGFVYFDVPCQPTYRIADNRHFRSYAPASIQERLLVEGLTEVNRGYSLPEPHAGTWCHEPTVDRVPYWFVAVLAQKAAC